MKSSSTAVSQFSAIDFADAEKDIYNKIEGDFDFIILPCLLMTYQRRIRFLTKERQFLCCESLVDRLETLYSLYYLILKNFLGMRRIVIIQKQMVNHILSRISGFLTTIALCLMLMNFLVFGQESGAKKVLTTLQVVDVSPVKNSNIAPVNTSVRVTFSDQLNTNTVSEASYRVWGNISGRHSGSITIDHSTITLTPDVNFIRGEKVQVVLTDNITSSVTGLRLSGGYSWEFQTATLLVTNDTFKVAANPITPSVAPYALAVGDFNRDGYPDLAVSNTDNNSISLYLNNQVGGFLAPQSYAAGTGPSKLIAADINNDGAVDLIVVNTASNSIGVFKNNGNGMLETMVSYTVGTAPKALSVADINNDGSLDIVVANSTDNTLTVLKNDGSGSFSLAQTITVGSGPSAVVLKDLDNDGAVDGVVSNKNSNNITLLKNAAGMLSVDTSYVISGTSAPNDVAVFDFDNNGTADIAIANSGSNNIAILLNAYSGNRIGRFYTGLPLIPFGVISPTCLYGNDFDADGDIDLVMASQTAGTNSMTIVLNAGFGVPTQIDIPVGKGTRDVVGADFSGQFGIIDFIAAGTDGKLRIFRNQAMSRPAGTVKLSVQQIIFNETAIGDTMRKSVSIYSLLVSNTVDSVTHSNSAFSLVYSLPAFLNAYDSTSVKIVFAPKGLGTYSDTLRVYSNSTLTGLTIPLSGIGAPINGVTGETLLAQTFLLEQNYPNPFNPMTVISYQLPNVGTQYIVSLRVFDLLGREVVVLVNDVKGPGTYSVPWDAARFSSGIYLYSLTSIPIGRTIDKIFTATKKLILIK
jgi:hypothetical protein